LIFVQTALFSFHRQKCPDDHHVGHISSPPSISTLKTSASFHPHLSPLSAAPAPSEQSSISSHHRRRLRNHLGLESTSSRDGTAAAVNLTAAPATQTFPILFDHPEVAGNAIQKANR
jgi:hypothetical protein